MTGKLVKQLEYNASRDDEKAFLEKVRELAGEGTYAASLLSKDLIDWFVFTAKKDVSCDLMHDYNTQAAKIYELTSQIETMHQNARKDEDAFNTKIFERDAVLEDARKYQAEILRRNKDLVKAYEDAIAECTNLNARIGCILIEKLDLEQKVTQLKAAIYDLEHSSEREVLA